MIAVDPSSRRTGGALLGDRARIATDPEDRGVYVRSMAARDRLGGLSDQTVAAMVLMRAIYDLADLDKSVYIHSTGQSGNLLSPLYRNFAERWSRVEYIPMSMKKSDATADSLGTLWLQPR